MEAARRASSLPSGVFKAMNPAVEAKLADGVAEVFLRHMQTGDAPKTEKGGTTPPPTRPGNRVAPTEVAEFIADLEARDQVDPPTLMAGIATERLWILSDLSATGMPGVREQALAEIERFVQVTSQDDSAATTFLNEVSEQLANRERSGDLDALAQIMQVAARDATADVDEEATS